MLRSKLELSSNSLQYLIPFDEINKTTVPIVEWRQKGRLALTFENFEFCRSGHSEIGSTSPFPHSIRSDNAAHIIESEPSRNAFQLHLKPFIVELVWTSTAPCTHKSKKTIVLTMPRATTATIAATLVVVPLLLLIIATESINAFSLNNNNNNHYRHPDKRKMKTRLFYEVFPDIPPKDDSGLSYAERSRPYRRVVFTHEDWIRHRSPDRFSGRFLKFIQSGIVRALINEVALVTCVATFILFYNALFVYGVDGFGSGVQYDPVLSFDLPAMRLPMIFFSLSSPALSLLLGTWSWRFKYN